MGAEGTYWGDKAATEVPTPGDGEALQTAEFLPSFIFFIRMLEVDSSEMIADE